MGICKLSFGHYCLTITTIVLMVCILVVLSAALTAFHSLQFDSIYQLGYIGIIIGLIASVVVLGISIYSLFRQNRWTHIIMAIILGLFSLLLLVLAISVFSLKNAIVNVFESEYSTFPDKTLEKIETALKCCGQNSETMPIRCNDSGFPGCSERIQTVINDYSTGVGVVLIILFVVLSTILSLSVFLIIKHRPTGNAEVDELEEELDSGITPGQPAYKIPVDPSNNSELPSLDYTEVNLGL